MSWILMLALAVFGVTPAAVAVQGISAEQPTILNPKSLSFVIDEATRFLGPSEQPIAVRRILGIDRSLMISELSQDSRFVLINPHRMLFEEFGFLDTGEFLATTLQLYGRREAKAAISSSTVHVSEHGYVALMTPGVPTEGVIIAGVSSAASVPVPQDKVLLDLMSDGLIRYAIGENELGQMTGVDGKAVAKASAEGGTLEPGQMLINARSAADIQRSVVNSNKIPRAHRLIVQNGSVRLEGESVMEARGKSERPRALDKADNNNSLRHEPGNPKITETKTAPPAVANAAPSASSHDATRSVDKGQRSPGRAPVLVQKPVAPSSEPTLQQSHRAHKKTGPTGKAKTHKSSPYARAQQPQSAPPIASQGVLPEWMKYLPKADSD